MKTALVLDIEKWRCGSESQNPSNRLGSGDTWLCSGGVNNYMCCLGQFALQYGLTEEQIRWNSTPAWLDYEIPGFAEPCDGKFRNTCLSQDLLIINDSMYTTIQEKIDRLRKRLEADNFELIVINNNTL